MQHNISEVIKEYFNGLVGKKVNIYTITERSPDYKWFPHDFSCLYIPQDINGYDKTTEEIIKYTFEDEFNHYPTVTFYFSNRSPVQYKVGEQSYTFETVD